MRLTIRNAAVVDGLLMQVRIVFVCEPVNPAVDRHSATRKYMALSSPISGTAGPAGGVPGEVIWLPMVRSA
jgi:hypothetical protein